LVFTNSSGVSYPVVSLSQVILKPGEGASLLPLTAEIMMKENKPGESRRPLTKLPTLKLGLTPVADGFAW
jgi:hypothetical protein